MRISPFLIKSQFVVRKHVMHTYQMKNPFYYFILFFIYEFFFSCTPSHGHLHTLPVHLKQVLDETLRFSIERGGCVSVCLCVWMFVCVHTDTDCSELWWGCRGWCYC